MPRQKKLKCLDLFSGIGGNALALRSICKTIGYCEIDPFAVSVLEANMRRKNLDKAPIFPDVTKLKAVDIPTLPDGITASFPCQDISSAGTGKGIKGERSGLYVHIVRLVQEFKKHLNHDISFVLMENSPMIQYRGLPQIIETFERVGFSCNWVIKDVLSVGGRHLRRRWFMVAKNKRSSSTLPHITSFKFDFDKLDKVPRLTAVVDTASKYSARKRYCTLGNAVVPSVVVAAWNALNHPEFEKEVAYPNLPLLKFVNGTKCHTWQTPINSESTWYPNKSYSGRQFRLFATFVFHEFDTQKVFKYDRIEDARKRWMLNPQWIETLMGFPVDWTLS